MSIEDIEIHYLGIRTKVSHSFYKPVDGAPARIRYTFHLPARKVTIEQLIDSNHTFYWSEINKGRTEFATELGEALENFQNENEFHDTNLLDDIEIIYKGDKVRVIHSMATKGKDDTGNIVYTFQLLTGPVTIRQYKKDEDFLWEEVPGTNTILADELGKILEEYYNEE